MSVRIFTIVPAIVLALGAATALAQPTEHPFAQFDQASPVDHSPSLRPCDQVSAKAANAAYVGDGSSPSYLRDQQQLMQEPGYSIGTGVARVSSF